MTYSLTGFAYLSIFLAIGYLTYRFYQYWLKERSLNSKLWLCFAVLFGAFVFIKTIGGLFFAQNPAFLEWTINAGVFLQSLALAFLAYFVISNKLPKLSPRLGFISVLILGLITTYLVVLIPYDSFLDSRGVINWGTPAGALATIVSILRFILFLAVVLPLIIFLRESEASKDLYLKRKTIGVGLTFFFLLAVVLVDFLFVNVLKLDPFWRDVGLIILGLTLFITLLITQRSSPTYVTKI